MTIYENEIVRLTYEKQAAKLFIYLKKAHIFSLEVLDGIAQIVEPINTIVNLEKVEAIVSISEDPSTWGLGGDLKYFFHCIQEGKDRELFEYAHKCVQLISLNNSGFNTGLPSISILSGRAYGGGFESALSSNIILSRPRLKATFPEVKFGSFPGMGAYSMLTRKLGFKATDALIAEGKSYDADALEKLGIIDGVIAFETIEQLNVLLQPYLDAYLADPFKQLYHRIPMEELISGTNMWVDQMLALSNNDTSKIYRIFNLQEDQLKSQETTLVKKA